MSDEPASEDGAQTPADASPPAPLEQEAELAGGGGGAAPSPRARVFPLTATLALALALLAATGTGFLWWQYRQFYVSLSGVDADTQSALQRVRVTARELGDRATALEGALEALRTGQRALGERVDGLPARFSELERRLDTLQGVSVDVRQQWLRAEALYYLDVANTELELAGHWENAITALGLADARLRDLANPALGPVRSAIAEELLALRAVRLPDTAGLSYTLARLSNDVASLPMRGEPPGSFAARGAQDLQDAEPGIARLWLAIKSAFRSLVSVQKRAAPAERALTAEGRELAQQQLAVELEMARLALLRTEQEVFKASLGAARELLQRDFDVTAAPVESALALLAQLDQIDIAPARPDISRSLNLLRSLPGGAE